MDIFKDYKPGERVRIVGYSEASCNAYGNVDEVTKTGLTLSTTPYGGNLKERPFNFVEVELPVVSHKALARQEASKSLVTVPVGFALMYSARLLRVIKAADKLVGGNAKARGCCMLGQSDDLEYSGFRVSIPAVNDPQLFHAFFPFTLEGVSITDQRNIDSALTAFESALFVEG